MSVKKIFLPCTSPIVQTLNGKLTIFSVMYFDRFVNRFSENNSIPNRN